jgi:uncharacterized protein YPO0396
VPRDGLLVTGPSGAGKTTLLDAYSTMIIPPQWLEYNSAARDSGRRDRNSVSYVRGAWAALRTEEQGQIVTQFLRPGTTWSALALTFNKGLGQFLTLLQLFWLRGAAKGSIGRHYFVLRRELSLEELRFNELDFSVRELRKAIDFDLEAGSFEEYQAHFGEILGLAPNALRLLQKTQSMKNIEDLDSFLRNFMLDVPNTFDAASELVEEFTALNLAHEAVLKAKSQMEVLGPIRLGWNEHVRAGAGLAEARLLSQSLEAYCGQRRMALIREELAGLETREADLRRQALNLSALIRLGNEKLNDLRAQYAQNDGDLLDRCLADREERKGRLAHMRSELEKARSAAEALGLGLGDGQEGFAALQARAQAELDGLGERRRLFRQAFKTLVGLEDRMASGLAGVEREIACLGKQAGNIPADDWELREAMIGDLGLDGGSLPFVGQLVSVKDDHGGWEAAIERALAPLARSVLVEEGQYLAVTEYANARHLGGRLSFLLARTDVPDFSGVGDLSADSLLAKLEIRPGPFRQALVLELGRRLDLRCSASLDGFRASGAALTQEGQVKLDGALHEKDDRAGLGDERGFLLGADPSRKLSALRRDKERREAELSGIRARLGDNDSQEAEMEKRAGQCRLILDLGWEGIDVSGLSGSISELDERIRSLQNKDRRISELRDEITRQERHVDNLRRDNAARDHEIIVVTGRTSELSSELRHLMSEKEIYNLKDDIKAQLDKYFIDHGKLSLKNIDSVMRRVEKAIGNIERSLDGEQKSHELFLQASFRDFMAKWPEDSLDVRPELSYSSDFIYKLEALEKDSLPRLQGDFNHLLQKQGKQKGAALLRWMDVERQEILKRMGLVNESLAGIPFSQTGGKPSFLNLRTVFREPEEAVAFRASLRGAVSQIGSQDPDLDEESFRTLKRLVADLSSQDRDRLGWRDRVLDVRRHFEFTGLEFDGDKNELETYRSGAGKSGGQRQKLAATCLAAALRYQLGGAEQGFPRFGTVVFDEAFDKIDAELTVLALKIFNSLGFQMILATPMKNIPLSEPFVGGAVYVSIADRRKSGVTAIVYDQDRRRLLWPEGGGGHDGASQDQASPAGGPEGGPPPIPDGA